MQDRQAPAQAGQQEAGSEVPDQGVEGRSRAKFVQVRARGAAEKLRHDADKGDRTD